MGLPHTQACVKRETRECTLCRGEAEEGGATSHPGLCKKRDRECTLCRGEAEEGGDNMVQEKGQREGRGARKPNCGSVRVVTVTIHSQEPQ